ncbi:ABC transporter permease [Streptomyces abyssomicinicus]|uniref:ABC transporter permease n=1 Tax=Streptomyces abyssomicinicus TaxID=574929 RepID=UPI00124FA611|nr:ABC transporter permease [Streptomyces abyssomicinicus]
MTTAPHASPRTAQPAVPQEEPRPRFADLVAAEWIKLRSLRSTWIAHGAAALAVTGLNAGTAYDTYAHWEERTPADRAAFVRAGLPLQEAFTVNAAVVTTVALCVLGALPLLGEFATGALRTTFTAVPARSAVTGAKAVVVAGFATAWGALVTVVSFLLTQAILDGRGVGIALDGPGVPRVLLASTLLAPVCALTGLALAAALRRTAATVLASVTAVMVLPLLLGEDRYWTALARHALLLAAWLRLTAPGGSAPPPYPWTEAGAWTVYAVWATAAVSVTVLAVRRRDV